MRPRDFTLFGEAQISFYVFLRHSGTMDYLLPVLREQSLFGRLVHAAGRILDTGQEIICRIIPTLNAGPGADLPQKQQARKSQEYMLEMDMPREMLNCICFRFHRRCTLKGCQNQDDR